MKKFEINENYIEKLASDDVIHYCEYCQTFYSSKRIKCCGQRLESMTVGQYRLNIMPYSFKIRVEKITKV